MLKQPKHSITTKPVDQPDPNVSVDFARPRHEDSANYKGDLKIGACYCVSIDDLSDGGNNVIDLGLGATEKSALQLAQRRLEKLLVQVTQQIENL